MKTHICARINLTMAWLIMGGCEIRGAAGEISFERSCYSVVPESLLTVNAQVRDETGAGIGDVKVKPVYIPNTEGLKAQNEVVNAGSKMINTFVVEGIVSIAITPSAEAVGREYFLTLQTTDGPTVSASTTIRIQSMGDGDKCVSVR